MLWRCDLERKARRSKAVARQTDSSSEQRRGRGRVVKRRGGHPVAACAAVRSSAATPAPRHSPAGPCCSLLRGCKVGQGRAAAARQQRHACHHRPYRNHGGGRIAAIALRDLPRIFHSVPHRYLAEPHPSLDTVRLEILSSRSAEMAGPAAWQTATATSMFVQGFPEGCHAREHSSHARRRSAGAAKNINFRACSALVVMARAWRVLHLSVWLHGGCARRSACRGLCACAVVQVSSSGALAHARLELGPRVASNGPAAAVHTHAVDTLFEKLRRARRRRRHRHAVAVTWRPRHTTLSRGVTSWRALRADVTGGVAVRRRAVASTLAD